MRASSVVGEVSRALEYLDFDQLPSLGSSSMDTYQSIAR